MKEKHQGGRFPWCVLPVAVDRARAVFSLTSSQGDRSRCPLKRACITLILPQTKSSVHRKGVTAPRVAPYTYPVLPGRIIADTSTPNEQRGQRTC